MRALGHLAEHRVVRASTAGRRPRLGRPGAPGRSGKPASPCRSGRSREQPAVRQPPEASARPSTARAASWPYSSGLSRGAGASAVTIRPMPRAAAEGGPDQLAHVGGDRLDRPRRIDQGAPLRLGARKREKPSRTRSWKASVICSKRCPPAPRGRGRPVATGTSRITVRSGRRSPKTVACRPPRRRRPPRPGIPASNP